VLDTRFVFGVLQQQVPAVTQNPAGSMAQSRSNAAQLGHAIEDPFHPAARV